jgi:hypothetical protein
VPIGTRLAEVQRFKGVGRVWTGLTRLWKCVEKSKGRMDWLLSAPLCTINFWARSSQTSAFVCRLARSRKLDYPGTVASGVFPPTRYLLFQLRIKFL